MNDAITQVAVDDARNTDAPSGQQTGKDDAREIAIPLDQIWAQHTPGTKSIFELDPDGDFNSLRSLPREEMKKRWQNSPLRQISEALTADIGPNWPHEGQEAQPGFVVAGTGADVLRAAQSVIVGGKQPAEVFPAGTQITAVFFKYAEGNHVQLIGANRRGNEFVVDYRFVTPIVKSIVEEFALIPLGQLTQGKYQVDIRQLPAGREKRDRTYADWDTVVTPSDRLWGRRFVCHSFSFEMKAAGEQ